MFLLRYILLSCLIVMVTACSGNQSLESRLAPVNQENKTKDNNLVTPVENLGGMKLPDDFPKDIPVYNQAKLMAVDGKQTVWSSIDPLNLITEFYRQELTAQNWNIIQEEENLIVATKPDSQESFKLSLTANNDATEFIITYEKEATAIITPQTNTNPTTPDNVVTSPNDDKLPLDNQTSSSLEELVRLQIIPPTEKRNPLESITRREYARWLVKVNNLIYSDVNSKLIRLATPNNKPVFTDIPINDPDFAIIQGLAEAGLIPSSLTQSSSSIEFKPEMPLTREELITWKIPLDFRQKLPNATLDTIKETWGFQDATKISPQAWQELYVDWQNGEESNIRRGFGYITLFQPQKPVTLEEAAKILNTFGYQGDIRTLKDVKNPTN